MQVILLFNTNLIKQSSSVLVEKESFWARKPVRNGTPFFSSIFLLIPLHILTLFFFSQRLK